MTDIDVGPVGYALGAKVDGIDLRRSIDEPTYTALRRAWLEHIVLVIPGQDLDEQQFLDFAELFGELEQIKKANRDERYPNLGYVTNRPTGGRTWDGHKGGVEWHSDESYTTRPTSATILLAKVVPPVGGDTMFANQYAAYAALSPTMQGLIDGLELLHPPSALAVKGGASPHPTAQPLVRVHPETGRKALFLQERARRFVGMSEEESAPILSYLKSHAVSYEFCYRHVWKAGDLVMWDNRSALHIALRDYDEAKDARHLLRAATVGEESGREYEAA